jgi:cysteine desulfurase
VDYIYLDNDSATRLDDRVVKAMLPRFSESYGAASSEFGHRFGVESRKGVEAARAIIAEKIGASPGEILFTSGVAESNNLALRGAVSPKKGMLTSAIEQNTVLNTAKSLAEDRGISLKISPVDQEGFIDFRALEKSLDENIGMVSIQHANQEIGTVQDIAKIGKLCRERGVLFHCDASHSFLKTGIDVERMNVDLMTLSAHNIYGPKGAAALYVRKGVEINPLFYGGGEQKGLRPGLEDVPSIVGFGKAVGVYDEKDNKRMAGLRDYLIASLVKIKDTELNGPREKRLCNNVNISFKYIEGESILLHLDMRGIAVTTGSACFSQDLMPSHVISAIGRSHADAHGSVRFSLSKYNTKGQMDYVTENVREVVEKLREISPLNER